jgi:acetylornithine deacetylase/succinyl-diaminopimelate desuccinylase-like protein
LIDVTRAQFAATAALRSGQIAADMKTVAANGDAAAIARLSADPYWNALLRTTCVPTEIAGGHALNALPQPAVAMLNCRLLPGHSTADVVRTIRDVVGDNEIDVSWSFVRENRISRVAATRRRPLRQRRVTEQLWPTAAVVPVLETGGSDGRFLRAAGIPTYDASGVFSDEGEYRAHGRDERIRVRDFYQGVEFYDQVIRALVSQR